MINIRNQVIAAINIKQSEEKEDTDLHKVEGRCKTYKDWPNSSIEPLVLAQAGFYYTGINDIVRCAYCPIEGHRWESQDSPMEDHINWNREQNRNCPFVAHGDSDDSSNETPSVSHDTCGKYGVEILPHSLPENVKHLEKLGITIATAPTHPEHITYDNRLATYSLWPKSLKQKPKDLAAAGFFYLGVGDQTLCFHCGGGLKDWEESDDPWEQHALWFSKCNYLVLKKGQDFIKQVQGKSKDTPSASASACTTNTTTSDTKEDKKDEDDEKKVEESTLCKICFKNELGVVFLPCGHIVACVDCASALKNCAVCRKPLEATVRAFLS